MSGVFVEVTETVPASIVEVDGTDPLAPATVEIIDSYDTVTLVEVPDSVDVAVVEVNLAQDGANAFVVQRAGQYPPRPSLPSVTFIGTINPDTLGLMVVGDIWINTADSDGPKYLAGSIGPTNPNLTVPGVWWQTGLGADGSGMTLWIEDGL